MKILYLVHQFYPEYQTGTEKFVFNIAHMAQKMGHKVKVITYNVKSMNFFRNRIADVQYDTYFYEGLNVLAYRSDNEPANLHYDINANLATEFAEEILRREKPDLIHVGHLMRVYPLILAAQRLNIPYIITLTDFHSICPKIILAPTKNSLCSGPSGGKTCKEFCGDLPENYIKERLRITKDILLQARAVFAPSKFLASVFEHEVEGLTVNVNHHGIPQPDIYIHRKHYNAGDKIRFGFLGYLAHHKGVHILIEAYKKLQSSQASLSFFGSSSPEYMKTIKSMAKDTDIEFHGPYHSSDLPGIFDQIDVLVTPSINYETYLFVLHEAFIYEVPVIGTDLGGMKEKIEDDFNGFTFTAGDVNELSSIMQKIVDNPEILNELKTNIRNKMVIPIVEQEAYAYNLAYRALTNNDSFV